MSSGAVDMDMTASQQFSYKAPATDLDQPFLFSFKTLMDPPAKPGSEIRWMAGVVAPPGKLPRVFVEVRGEKVEVHGQHRTTYHAPCCTASPNKEAFRRY